MFFDGEGHFRILSVPLVKTRTTKVKLGELVDSNHSVGEVSPSVNIGLVTVYRGFPLHISLLVITERRSTLLTGIGGPVVR